VELKRGGWRREGEGGTGKGKEGERRREGRDTGRWRGKGRMGRMEGGHESPFLPSYSKMEGIMPLTQAELTPHHQLMDFTFLLISAGDSPLFNGSHVVVARSEGFSHLSLDWREFPPLKIVLREAVLVLMRKRDARTCRTDYQEQ
jgi:hypothetical protein